MIGAGQLLDLGARLLSSSERQTSKWRAVVMVITLSAMTYIYASSTVVDVAPFETPFSLVTWLTVAAVAWAVGLHVFGKRASRTVDAMWVFLDVAGIGVLVGVGAPWLAPLLALLPLRTVSAGTWFGDAGFLVTLLASALASAASLAWSFPTHVGWIMLGVGMVVLMSLGGYLTLRRATARPNGTLQDAGVLGMVSHELRNPLNVILSASSLFDRTKMDPDAVARIDIIESCGRAMLDLVSELLDSTAVLDGRVRLLPVDFHLRHLVARVSDALGPSADAKAIRLSWSVQDNIPPLFASKRHLEQVVINLGVNAVKYTPPGGKVHLSVHHYPAATPGDVTLVFAITDTGPGISDTDRRRIFEPFSQVGIGAGKRYDGVGLGLHIVRRLSDAMGGTIDVTSAPGSGSVFTWQVPARISSRTDQMIVSTVSPITLLDAHRARTTPLRCLVIDDLKVNTVVLGQLLTRGGHTFDAITNAHAAEQAIRARAHDIVFLDLHMPEVTGWDVLDRLQGETGLPPVIVQSAAVDDESHQSAVRLGAAGFLGKPVELTSLLQVLERVASQHSASTSREHESAR